MAWRLIDKPKTLKVTKKLATTFATMEAPPHDRPLSERRLLVYQRLLNEGGFRPVTWATVLCKETGGVYRVNGKHTSTMLSGLEELPEFYAIIEEYECDTLEDVARLYGTFDSKVQVRSANDIYLSFAGVIPELKILSARTIRLAVTGIDAWLSGGSGTTRTGSSVDRAERLLDYPEFVVWMDNILSSGAGESLEQNRKSSRHMQRSSVAGAMLGTWLRAKGDSEAFWTAVRDESGASQNLPDRKLARYLLTVGVAVGMGNNRVRAVSPREMFVKCIHAWNAWRKQEPTDMRYYADKDVPAIK